MNKKEIIEKIKEMLPDSNEHITELIAKEVEKGALYQCEAPPPECSLIQCDYRWKTKPGEFTIYCPKCHRKMLSIITEKGNPKKKIPEKSIFLFGEDEW